MSHTTLPLVILGGGGGVECVCIGLGLSIGAVACQQLTFKLFTDFSASLVSANNTYRVRQIIKLKKKKYKQYVHIWGNLVPVPKGVSSIS